MVKCLSFTTTYKRPCSMQFLSVETEAIRDSPRKHSRSSPRMYKNVLATSSSLSGSKTTKVISHAWYWLSNIPILEVR